MLETDQLKEHLRDISYRVEGKIEDTKAYLRAIALILKIESSPELLELQTQLVARQEMLTAKLAKTIKKLELIEKAIASTCDRDDGEPDFDSIPF